MSDVIAKKLKDPFRNICQWVAQKALSKIRYVLMQSEQVAKQQTKKIFELEQRATKRRPSTLWRSFQQREHHQISQQQCLGSYNRG